MPLSHTKREELRNKYYAQVQVNNILQVNNLAVMNYWLKVLDDELENQKKGFVERIETIKRHTGYEIMSGELTEYEGQAKYAGLKEAINIIHNQ